MTETQQKEQGHASGAKDPIRGEGSGSAGALEQHDARRIAVAAECSPATVSRFWAGLPVRNLSERRIVRALETLGIAGPVRAA